MHYCCLIVNQSSSNTKPILISPQSPEKLSRVFKCVFRANSAFKTALSLCHDSSQRCTRKTVDKTSENAVIVELEMNHKAPPAKTGINLHHPTVYVFVVQLLAGNENQSDGASTLVIGLTATALDHQQLRLQQCKHSIRQFCQNVFELLPSSPSTFSAFIASLTASPPPVDALSSLDVIRRLLHRHVKKEWPCHVDSIYPTRLLLPRHSLAPAIATTNFGGGNFHTLLNRFKRQLKDVVSMSSFPSPSNNNNLVTSVSTGDDSSAYFAVYYDNQMLFDRLPLVDSSQQNSSSASLIASIRRQISLITSLYCWRQSTPSNHHQHQHDNTSAAHFNCFQLSGSKTGIKSTASSSTLLLTNWRRISIAILLFSEGAESSTIPSDAFITSIQLITELHSMLHRQRHQNCVTSTCLTVDECVLSPNFENLEQSVFLDDPLKLQSLQNNKNSHKKALLKRSNSISGGGGGGGDGSTGDAAAGVAGSGSAIKSWFKAQMSPRRRRASLDATSGGASAGSVESEPTTHDSTRQQIAALQHQLRQCFHFELANSEMALAGEPANPATSPTEQIVLLCFTTLLSCAPICSFKSLKLAASSISDESSSHFNTIIQKFLEVCQRLDCLSCVLQKRESQSTHDHNKAFECEQINNCTETEEPVEQLSIGFTVFFSLDKTESNSNNTSTAANKVDSFQLKAMQLRKDDHKIYICCSTKTRLNAERTFANFEAIMKGNHQRV